MHLGGPWLPPHSVLAQPQAVRVLAQPLQRRAERPPSRGGPPSGHPHDQSRVLMRRQRRE